jgi:hypothetical protein
VKNVASGFIVLSSVVLSAYMCIIAGTTDILIKSGLFALGCKLYRIMTGPRPYEGHLDFIIKAVYKVGNFLI